MEYKKNEVFVMYGYELETYKQTKKLMDALTRLLVLSHKACFPEKILIN
ncbi:MAG: hypothetical protein Q4A96_02795 [Candidatus Saccharibacteria bacterium]|nr:hypothetical protein [Candidatus Saccharibacteria bacterium]